MGAEHYKLLPSSPPSQPRRRGRGWSRWRGVGAGGRLGGAGGRAAGGQRRRGRWKRPFEFPILSRGRWFN